MVDVARGFALVAFAAFPTFAGAQGSDYAPLDAIRLVVEAKTVKKLETCVP